MLFPHIVSTNVGLQGVEVEKPAETVWGLTGIVFDIHSNSRSVPKEVEFTSCLSIVEKKRVV